MNRNLRELADNKFELLIVGGGIYGAVICWLSTISGLKVALIEQKDFGHAASANSQKIIHGGLRYLQNMDFFRVLQSLIERSWLMWLAPHLVNPLRCLMPIYGHGLKGKEAMVVGLNLYNLIARYFNTLEHNSVRLPEAGIVNTDETIKLYPKIERKGLKGAAFWYEGFCQNTERLVLSFIKSAHRLGAVAANYTEAIRYKQYQDGSVVVSASDHLSGQTIEIKADRVINCTGPWFNNTIKLLTNSAEITYQNFAGGLNIVTRPIFSKQTAIAFRNIGSKDARLFFTVPWRGLSIIGTEWFHFNNEIDQFRVEEEHCATILAKINAAYPPACLTLNDVAFIHGGVVPCAPRDRSGSSMPNISKRFRMVDSSNYGQRRIVNILGVKYTTAGDVARKVLKFVYPSIKVDRYHSRLIDGNFDNFEAFKRDILRKWENRLDVAEIDRLLTNYGSEFNSLMACVEIGGARNSNGKVSQADVLKAETWFAIRQEMAQKLSDVVLRRTDRGTAGMPSESNLRSIASLMGEELGWSGAKIIGEIEEVKQAYPSFLQTIPN